jgi:excisionase family DNA binding protein
MNDWTTPQELAAKMKVSVGNVYRKIHNGEWPVDTIGPRTYRFTPEQIEEIRSLVAPKPSKTRRNRVREALRNAA